MRPLALLVAAAVVSLAACAHHDPEFTPEPMTNARVAPSDLKPGDCAEALRRAVEHPDLEVDRLPAPIVMKPAPLRRVPPSALRKDGSADVKVDVIIDTLGQPDMSTFRVVKTSSTWLASNVKSTIGKWKFTPAELAGCKVPRVYHFMASAPQRQSHDQ